MIHQNMTGIGMGTGNMIEGTGMGAASMEAVTVITTIQMTNSMGMVTTTTAMAMVGIHLIKQKTKTRR